MFRITRKWSVYLSMFLACAALVGLIVLAFFMPGFAEYLISLPDYSGVRDGLPAYAHALILTACYVILAIALCGVGLVLYLLILVRAGKVFTSRAVGTVRAISWLLFAAAAAFGATAFFFEMLLAFAFVCLLVGLIARVIKNVLEEAVHLKNDNDLTI